MAVPKGYLDEVKRVLEELDPGNAEAKFQRVYIKSLEQGITEKELISFVNTYVNPDRPISIVRGANGSYSSRIGIAPEVDITGSGSNGPNVRPDSQDPNLRPGVLPDSVPTTTSTRKKDGGFFTGTDVSVGDSDIVQEGLDNASRRLSDYDRRVDGMADALDNIKSGISDGVSDIYDRISNLFSGNGGGGERRGRRPDRQTRGIGVDPDVTAQGSSGRKRSQEERRLTRDIGAEKSPQQKAFDEEIAPVVATSDPAVSRANSNAAAGSDQNSVSKKQDEVLKAQKFLNKVIDEQFKYKRYDRDDPEKNIKRGDYVYDESGNKIVNTSYKDGYVINPATGEGLSVKIDEDGIYTDKLAQTLSAVNSSLPENLRIGFTGKDADFKLLSKIPETYNGVSNLARRTAPDLLRSIGSNPEDSTAKLRALASPATLQGVDPVINEAPGPGVVDRLSSFLNSSNGETAVGNLIDGVKASVALGRAANIDVPQYETPAEYRRLGRDLQSRSNLGFSAEEQGAVNDRITSTRNANVQALAEATGGGGTAGAVLAGIDRIFASERGAITDLAVADNNIRNRNFSQNARFIAADQNREYNQEFLPAQTSALNNIVALQTAAAANINNIQQRTDFNRAFGDGSTYQRLQEAQISANERLGSIYQDLNTKGLNSGDGFGYSADDETTKRRTLDRVR